MKLTRPSEVRARLEARGIHPSKALGQNFLIDANILRILVDSAALTPEDRVLEIGPGLGVLTRELLEQAGRVCAIEMDDALYQGLCEEHANLDHLELIHGDALDVPLERIRAFAPTKLVSNLPYGSGNRILMEYFMNELRFERLVVTVQDEVAQRFAAEPGGGTYSLLTVWAQLDYRVSIRKTISPSCFYPPPRVNSAIVVFERRTEDTISLNDRTHFGALLKLMFTQRRKQVGTLLKKAPKTISRDEEAWRGILESLGVAPTQRPETVSVSDWVALSNGLSRTEPS